MTRPEEVKSFARDYINGNRTKERRMAIRAAYFQLTGESLRLKCETCYIEAIYKILKLMEKKPCNYRLLKGAVLQAFGDADKFCTNDNLTDELAEWHLKHTRGAASLFSHLPEDAPTYIDPNDPIIIPPVEDKESDDKKQEEKQAEKPKGEKSEEKQVEGQVIKKKRAPSKKYKK